MKELSPWRIRRIAEPEDIEPEYVHRPQPNEFHLSDYWNILVKHRFVIVITFLLISGLGAYFPLTATKLYTASATIKIEPRIPQITGVGVLQPSEGLLGEYDYYQTQFALLRTRALAARVITDLSLGSNRVFTSLPIISPNPLDHIQSWIFKMLGYLAQYVGPLFRSPVQSDEPQTDTFTASLFQADAALNVSPHLIGRYLGFLYVQPVSRTRLVRVVFTTPDPALSQALANAHVQSFLRVSLEDRFSLTEEAREFLDQKKSELQEKLVRSEAALNRFRRTHGVVSVEKGENIVVDRLIELHRQLTVARAQRIEAESLYRTVEKKNYQDLAEVMRQGLVQQLKGNVATLQAEKARLSTIFKPDHPRIQDLDHQITLARQALDAEIANVVRGIRSSYAAALAKEGALETEANKQQQDALKMKELGVHYTALQEEVNAHRSLYENVLRRLSETHISNDVAISNMQISEMADKPSSASGPTTSRYLLASMISGLFFGVGIAFVREYFDSTVRTPDDIWRSVGLSTLGVVPHVKSLGRGQHNRAQIGPSNFGPDLAGARPAAKELIISHSPISILSESYRSIRTSLLLSQPDKPPQVVLLTSGAPSEGKTTTTLNLAIALANDGYSVLVVDGDMRKGCCHARMGLRNNRGLSNILTGGLSLEEGIQPTSVSGLSLLSRGVLPPNPTELLGSGRMREVLQQLRQTFKFILIDSPPVIGVSDAAVLSVASDGVLLVFDGQKTSTLSAQKAVERLDMVQARFLGVVLNGINLKDPHYSYYRSYSSYYAYESNGDEEVDEETDTNFDSAADRWDMGSRNKEHESPKPQAPLDSRSDSGNGADGGEASFTAGSAGNGPTTQGIPPEATLSQESLNKLIAALTNAIGPIAPLVVSEQITALGESQSAFPKSRIPDLFKLIQHEITKDELSRFKASMPDEFREFANT